MFSFLTPYLSIIKYGSIVVAIGMVVFFVHRYDEGQQLQAVLDATQKAAEAQKTQDAISLKSAVDAAQHQVEIRTVTQTITKRIPVYVAKTDACPVSSNYVRLWNDAVAGTDIFSATTGKPNVVSGSNANAH
ncbi:MAG: hypothetical protein KGJ13_07625 [Patescibacteria group bacterium]|nr:hypothetical protein [Patescibacteria group bacterium]